jgi:hypothetical protein
MTKRKSSSGSKLSYGSSPSRRKDSHGTFEGIFFNEFLSTSDLLQKGYDHILQDNKGKILRIKNHPQSNYLYFIAKRDGEYWIARAKMRQFGEKNKEKEGTKDWIVKLPIDNILMKERFFKIHTVNYKGKSNIVVISRSRKKKDHVVKVQQV